MGIFEGVFTDKRMLDESGIRHKASLNGRDQVLGIRHQQDVEILQAVN
jgi:hypothetical protein